MFENILAKETISFKDLEEIARVKNFRTKIVNSKKDKSKLF